MNFRIITLWICGLIFLAGCRISSSKEEIFQTRLEQTPIGKAVPVSAIIKTPFDQICILYPYVDKLNESDPKSGKIDEFLVRRGYVADEGHWAFVWADKEKIAMIEVDRDQDRDVLYEVEITEDMKEKWPETARLALCAKHDQAYLLKTKADNRTYYSLVEIIE